MPFMRQANHVGMIGISVEDPVKARRRSNGRINGDFMLSGDTPCFAQALDAVS
jgi:hypothetical protein